MYLLFTFESGAAGAPFVNSKDIVQLLFCELVIIVQMENTFDTPTKTKRLDVGRMNNISWTWLTIIEFPLTCWVTWV
jgi:hypothetical protein